MKVGCLVYDIEHPPTIEAGGECYFGECDNERQIIRIASMYPVDRKLQTMLHESLHAIAHVYCVPGLRERQVELLALGLTAFLRDNGLLKEDDPA